MAKKYSFVIDPQTEDGTSVEPHPWNFTITRKKDADFVQFHIRAFTVDGTEIPVNVTIAEPEDPPVEEPPVEEPPPEEEPPVEEPPVEEPEPQPGRVTLTPDDPIVVLGQKDLPRLHAIAVDENGDFLSESWNRDENVFFKDDWKFSPAEGDAGSEYFLVDEFGLVKPRKATGELTVHARAEHLASGMTDDVIVTIEDAVVVVPTDPDPTVPPVIPPVPPVQNTGLVAMVEEIIGSVGLPADVEFQQLLALAEKWTEWQWNNRLANPASSGIHTFNYYDHGGILYYLAALTGNDVHAQRADAIVAEYLGYAAKTPGDMVQPHQWQPRGVEIYARRTGDARAKAALDLYGWKLARQLDGTATFGYFIGGPSPNMDNRQVGRSILSVLAAVHTVGRTDLAGVILSEAVPRLEAHMALHGTHWEYIAPLDPIFLAAILVQALGDAERRGYADPRISAMCDRWLDDAWLEAKPTRNCQGQTAVTFPYMYGGSPLCYHHTLNGIYAVPYAQRYARTKDPAHRKQALELIRGALVSETWDNVGKQFAEVARSIWAMGSVAVGDG